MSACNWQKIEGNDEVLWCDEHLHMKENKQFVLEPSIKLRDIVDVIGKFVPLRKYKRFYIGRCPWHEDYTNCLEVIRGNQFYRCLVCFESGNALDFVCKYLNIAPEKALEYVRDITMDDYIDAHKKIISDDQAMSNLTS